MPTRVISNEVDRDALLRWIKGHKTPFTVDLTKGKRRSVEQNRLQRLLLNEIANQLQDQNAEEWRGYCKLTLGVPILRAEDEGFAASYDRYVKPLPYEQKLALMMEPLDLPVTRLMTVPQKTLYLEAIYKHFGEQGVVLTQPEAA